MASLMALFQGLTGPNSTSLVSISAGADAQGKTLGINQSVTSAAFATPPIIVGYIETINLSLLLVTAGLMALLGWFFFVRFIRREERLSPVADVQYLKSTI